MTTTHDPALEAVARVRGVREQDSLVALQQALADQHQREQQLGALQAQLTAAAALEADILGSGTPGALLTLRMTLGHLGDSMRDARDAVATAEVIADAARDRWEYDKSRLSAVEQLLERRAADRRAAAVRADDRRTDEIAGQGWLRRTTEEAS